MKHSPRSIQIGLIKRQIRRNNAQLRDIQKYRSPRRVELKEQFKKMLDKTHEMMGY